VPEPSGDIAPLKRAHERLTAAYVEVHKQAAGDRLMRPVVDDHLRRRVRALHDAYLHAAETTFRSVGDREWLRDEAERLLRLETTFRSQRNLGRALGSASMVFGLPGVVGLLSITGVTAGALALLNRCLCQLIGLVPLFASIVILLVFCLAFWNKRKLFREANTGTTGGVYGAEDDVFRAVGVDKEREPAVDLHGWLLITVIWAVATVIERTASGHLYGTSRGWLFWVLLGGAALMSVGTFVSSRIRQPA
jgi:hypothetical protein